MRGFFVHAIVPGLDANPVGGLTHRKLTHCFPGYSHEKPVVAGKPSGEWKRMARRRAKQHQLRFDSANAWRAREILHDRREQRIFVRRRVKARPDVEIADQALAFVADLVRVSGKLIADAQSEAHQRLHRHEAVNQFRRGPEIPGKFAAPDSDLLFEKRVELSQRHLAEFANFYERCIACRRHFLDYELTARAPVNML